jgi:hypothetical protein
MRNHPQNQRSSYWLRVFTNSNVNGATYEGDDLPVYPWAWPTGTYLQRRLQAVRAETVDVAVPKEDCDGLRRNRPAATTRHCNETAPAGSLH